MITLPLFYPVSPNPAQARANQDLGPYFAKLIAAGSSMNTNNQQALRRFVVGCINDGIWDSITSIVPLAGPSNLAGALVPLKGLAPTNNLFVSADHNIQTGLIGNGNNKYLNTGYTSSTFGTQNNAHIACFVTSVNPTNYLMGSTSTWVGFTGGGFQAAINSASFEAVAGVDFTPPANSFVGARRIASTIIVSRVGADEVSDDNGSAVPTDDFIHVFRNSGAGTLFTAARLAFYSLGNSLNMGLLRSRMGTYVNSLTLT